MERSLDFKSREKTPQEVAGRILWDISSGESGYTRYTMTEGHFCLSSQTTRFEPISSIAIYRP